MSRNNQIKHSETQVDLAVVGGGLAGLAAAALAANAGKSVVVVERAEHPGGRARSLVENGFVFNQGPHALYRKAAGMSVLKGLGITPRGSLPDASGGFAVRSGRMHTLPGGLVSLLTTGLFGVGGKFETARLLGGIAKIPTEPLMHIPVGRWIRDNLRDPAVRDLVSMLIRLTTYANAPEAQSAGSALAQLKNALAANVLYLHGGWQSIVDDLTRCVEGADVLIRCGQRVESVARDGDGWSVQTTTGRVRAAAVILALSPSACAGLLEKGGEDVALTVRGWAQQCVPIRAACLDLGLSELPDPRAKLAMGLDRPVYLSVHSAVASLAPAGKALVHVAKYLEADEDGGADAEHMLESHMDLVQPGWRDKVEVRRFMPSLTVSNGLVTACAGGEAGRPGPAVPGAEGLYVAGDWVGPRGMLADAALASAADAAALVISDTPAHVAA